MVRVDHSVLVVLQVLVAHLVLSAPVFRADLKHQHFPVVLKALMVPQVLWDH